MQGELDEAQQKWLPELQEKVDAISAKFTENFARIGSVGEVGLAQAGTDYAKYSIQIRVRFFLHLTSISPRFVLEMPGTLIYALFIGLRSPGLCCARRRYNPGRGRILLIRCIHLAQLSTSNRAGRSRWSRAVVQVKFRDEAPLEALSGGQHSGGEKSVSTIMYLLSLQKITATPFRVVDEINQGMDQINERRVFQVRFEISRPAIFVVEEHQVARCLGAPHDAQRPHMALVKLAGRPTSRHLASFHVEHGIIYI